MTTTADRILQHLTAYDVRKDGANEYRANSPLRPGANSHSFKLTVDESGEKGAYYDHVSEEGGTLYGLADLLGIERADGRAAVAETKRAYRDLAEYAAAHGVTADVLTAAGWSDVTTYQGRPALEFKTRTGKRYRFIDGEKPFYKSAMGYQASWYGLDRALALAEESWLPLVLCNGEVSTVVAQHNGIPACCVTAGEKAYPAALVDELKARRKGPVIIAMDCDTTGRKVAEAVKAQLAGMDVTVVDLGLGDKGDLADFCALYGAGAGAALLKLPSQSPLQQPTSVSVGPDLGALANAAAALTATMRQDAKLRKQADIELVCAQLQAELDRVRMMHAAPTLLSFADLSAENLKSLEWALANPDPVQGLRSRIPSLDKAIGGFLPEVYVIYGATGMGKSWTAVSLAREFITQGPGLVVTTESRPNRWQTRLAASLTHIPADRIETGMLEPDEVDRVRQAYKHLATFQCRALSNGSPTVAQVRAAVLQGECQWLIVDSASKMSAPGTNSIYDRTAAVSDGLQSIYQELNIPVIVTNQVGRDVAERSNKLPQLEDGYGGGVIEHNAGTVIALYRHQYYVDKGTEQPRPEYPDNMTLARILKNRWRPGSQVNAVKLMFVGSSGFYEAETVRVDLQAMTYARVD